MLKTHGECNAARPPHAYPSARDLEFFARRFLRTGEIYQVDSHLATYLVEWGYALFEVEQPPPKPDEPHPECGSGSNDASL
jgi:hypothetical protein